MSAFEVEPRIPSLQLESLFLEPLPVLPYGSFTQGNNIFFHEGLQASSPIDSGSLEGSGSAGHTADSPTAVVQDDEKSGNTKGRGGRKAGTKTRDQEQLERIRAKNRRAQSRYRAKLKAQAQDTVQSHDQVAEELTRLRQENAALSHSNDLMDRVLTVREGYMASLKGGTASASGPFALGTVTDPQQPSLALAELGSNHALADAEGRCPLTGLDVREVADIKSSNPAAVLAAWQSLVPRLEDALTQLGSAGNDSASDAAWAALHEALHEARMYCFEHAVYKPHNIQQLLAANLGVGTGSEVVAGHWAMVASKVALADGQRATLAPLREVFLRRIGRVMAERRAILGQLANAAPGTSLQALQQSTASWLRVNQATSELSANLQQEHLVCMEFVSRGFGGVLTPLQKAVAIVRSYPYFPDIYSITTASLGLDDEPTSILGAIMDQKQVGMLGAAPETLDLPNLD